MLMARGELSFRIRPVCESYVASKTIRQRIGRRNNRKIVLLGYSLLGFYQTDRATKAGFGIFARYFVGSFYFGIVSMYPAIPYNCCSLNESIFLDVFPKEKPTP